MPRHATKTSFKKGHVAPKGIENPNWKGDKVGYWGVHKWIRERKPKPALCESCKTNPPRDLANISGNYLRNINDYEYLCRSCHKKKDCTEELRIKFARITLARSRDERGKFL